MAKKSLGDCLRCGAPVYEKDASVCATCKKDLVDMHEKAEAMYAAEYAAEVGATRIEGME